MIRVVNTLALLAALLLGVVLSAHVGATRVAEVGSGSSTSARADAEIPDAGARTDAGDAGAPERPLRVASATTIGDQVLAEVADPATVIAISGQTSRGPAQWRLGDRPRIARLEDVEAILALNPDVLIASSLSAARPVARLREAGIQVVDLGETRGLSTLGESIERIGRAVGQRERAQVLWTRFEARMATRREASQPRVRGLFVGSYGGRLFGGAARTSYADVLDAAGVDDVASEAGREGWPEYAAEELIVLDPDYLVVPEGDTVCELMNLEMLRACRQGSLLRVAPELLGDPGLGMLDAADALRDAVEGALAAEN